MIESLTTKKHRQPVKPSQIVLKLEVPIRTLYTTSGFGSGFTMAYSIDGGPMTDAGTSFYIDPGDHTVIFNITKDPKATSAVLLRLTGMADSLVECVQWDSLNIQGVSFSNCKKLKKVPAKLCTSFTSMYTMLGFCEALEQDISAWDTSRITNMTFAFFGNTTFNQPLNSWDVSKVKLMQGTFMNCSSFNQPLSNWKLPALTTMDQIFHNATSFNQDLTSWIVAKTVDHTSYDDNTPAWQASFKPNVV